MKTYKVENYGGETSFTVSLDDSGVVEVDGLLPDSAEALKESVQRHMDRRGMSPAVALSVSVGSYSHLTEVDETVADSQ